LPQTWQRLDSLRGFPGVLDASTYSVALSFDPRDGGVEALFALRIQADAWPPPELKRRSLPAATCAAFRHVVRRGDVFPQISAARRWIYSHYVQRLPLSRVQFPAFEVFPQGLEVTAGSWVDYYFPLKK
jgi:hypothetical protein